MYTKLFMCLLSITLCYSLPANSQGKPLEATTVEIQPLGTEKAEVTQKDVQSSTPDSTKNTTETLHLELQPDITPSPVNNITVKTNTTAASANNTTAAPANNTTTPPGNSTTTPDSKTKKDDKSMEKSTDQSTEKSTKTTDPKVKPDSPTTVKPEKSEDKPTAKPDVKPEVTTAKADPTVKPTATPHSDEKKEIVQSRGFDGASFIGGMILTMGLLAVGFIGFKYYKNHAERNYHTL